MMMTTLTAQMAKSIHYVKPVGPSEEKSLLDELYQQFQVDFMPGPVLTLHSPAPTVMAGVWSLLRETLLAGTADRAAKETVAATISHLNACPFCVDAHSALLHATGNHAVVSALAHADAPIHDPHLAALVHWTQANERVATATVAPPFSPQDGPELLGTAFTFHYINRMANVFLGDSFLPLPTALKGLARRAVGATMGKRLVQPLPVGRSLRFVPRAPLPADLAWAAPNPAVAGAVAGFASIIEEAGQATLPAAVRTLTIHRLQQWQGAAPGLSRRWVDDAVADLTDRERAAARLTLLTALASYQVDEASIAAFRRDYPTDQQLIAATAWASFSAARRVLTWFTGTTTALQVEGEEEKTA